MKYVLEAEVTETLAYRRVVELPDGLTEEELDEQLGDLVKTFGDDDVVSAETDYIDWNYKEASEDNSAQEAKDEA